MDELYINGKIIDLGVDTVIAITRQANNIGELQNRQSDFSNTFEIPNNAHNRLALEHAGVMSSATDIPYRRNLATYKRNGVELFTNAEATIQQSINGSIQIDIIGGNVDILKRLGSITVGELFNDDTTHEWSVDEAIDSRDGSKYYIYPMIDFRSDNDTFFDAPTVDVKYMLPCCRVPALFERIESYTGLSFSGSYIDSPAHQNMIITPNALTIKPEFLSEEGSRAEGDPTPPTNFTFVEEGSGYITPDQNPITNSTINGTNFFQASFFPPANVVGKLRFAATIRIVNDYDFGQTPLFKQEREVWLVVQIKSGGTIIAEQTMPKIVQKPNYIIDQVVDVSTNIDLLLSGQQHFVNIIVHAEKHSNADTTVQTTLRPGWYFEYTPTDQLAYGSDIKFRDLFRMKAFDVLKDAINKRGVVIQTNSYTKNVSFNYFEDLEKNKAIAIDWSDKVDVEQTVMLYRFGNYAQRNWFRFAPDDNVESELGDHYFDIDDQTLDPETDVVQISHPATEQENRYLGINIPKIPTINSDTIWQNQKFRMLQLQTQDTSYNVSFTDGTNTTVVDTNIPFCKFEGFDVLVPEYYEVLRKMLQRSKVLPIIVKLDEPDVHDFNFIIPRQINIPEIDVSGYFYVNTIDSYRGKKNTLRTCKTLNHGRRKNDFTQS